MSKNYAVKIEKNGLKQKQKTKMECPVCSKSYSSAEIEEHVEACLSTRKSEEYEEKKGKRSYPFATGNSQEFPIKKQKLNHEKRDSTFSKYEKPSGSDLENIKNSVIDTVNWEDGKKEASLIEAIRPSSLDSFVGQKKLLSPEGILAKLLKNSQAPNMILWGPPGCGKSSLVNLIVKSVERSHQTKVVKLSAASSNLAEVKEVVASAAKDLKQGKRTVLVMKQLHRFNKLRQDIFLPHLESGAFIFVGTTSENPHFSLNPAVLSRCRIFEFEKLTEGETEQILKKGISALDGTILCRQENSTSIQQAPSRHSHSLRQKFVIDDKTVRWLANSCNGNAAAALGSLEIAVQTKIAACTSSLKEIPKLSVSELKNGLERFYCSFDGSGHLTFQLYSALHKSVRDGQANGGLYWLARLMAAKEDPVYIAKRLIRIAGEEISLADPEALDIAVHALQACEMIGMPECDVMLGQCVLYMARSSNKSRLVENALRKAQKTIFDRKESLTDLDPGQVDVHMMHEKGKSNLPPGLENIDFFHS